MERKRKKDGGGEVEEEKVNDSKKRYNCYERVFVDSRGVS